MSKQATAKKAASKKAAKPAPAAAKKAAAKKAVEETAPVATETPAADEAPKLVLAKGNVVKFTGYTDPDIAKEDKLFKKGDVLTVNKKGKYDGEYIVTRQSDGVSGPVYFDEVKLDESAKPVEQEATEETPVEFVEAPSIAELLSTREALDLAPELIAESNALYFRLGGVLANIKRHRLYETVKKGGKFVCKDTTDEKGRVTSGFQAYCDTVLGFTYRKAQYYIDIYETLAPMGIDESYLGKIGWPKAAKIAKVATAKNINKLLTFAEGHTGDELDNYISEKIIAAGEGSERGTNAKPRGGSSKTVIHVTLHEDQGNVVKQAFETAKDLLRQPGQEEPTEAIALHHISTEWLTTQANAEISLEAMVEYVQNKYNVDITTTERVGKKSKK
jgi:hypothetical protein